MPVTNPVALTITNGVGYLHVISSTINVHFPGTVNVSTIGAIWDTGATGSSITTKVVKQLGLIPTGFAQVNTANGIATQNTYIVDVSFPNGVGVRSVNVTELDALASGCDALIGMDIITLGDFSITNLNGVTCMSFRIPSCHEIDYEKTPNMGVTVVNPTTSNASNNYAGTPRNAPCPCNSNKKYKNCHGK